MTDHQENKRSMFLSVHGICIDKKDLWIDLQAFVNTFEKFEKIISEIDTQRQIQEGVTLGVTESKHKEEEEMTQITLTIAANVYAYASLVDDHELRNRVNYSPSTLRNARDTVLKDICQSVHDAASEVVSELEDYGVTPETLEKQQKEIDDFTEMLAKPRTAISARSTATARIEELIKEGDELLRDQLDKLMFNYKTRDPIFYNMYQSARKMVNMGHRSKNEESASEEPETETEI